MCPAEGEGRGRERDGGRGRERDETAETENNSPGLVETTDEQKNVAERCIIYAQGIGMKKQKDEPTDGLLGMYQQAQAHTSM